jgi:two-component system, LytTR family, response regulator
MKVVIIEDEQMAANRIKALLAAYDSDIEIIAHLDSVKKSAQWLLNNPHPSLIFMDIQLGDGISFEIFELVKITCPIIFITAYNEYAIQAFKVNSVDYLLKPLNKESLYQALEKYKKLFSHATPIQNMPEISLDVLTQLMGSFNKSYKNRFIVKVGEHIKAIAVRDILYFFSREGGSFLQCNDKKRYLLDLTMDQIEQQVNPATFYRINRQYLVSFEAIRDIISYSNSRLRLDLLQAEDQKEIIVSREKVSDFKEWLDK